MAAMNRLSYLYNEHILAALDYKNEWGFYFVYSSKDKQMRGNCVVDDECSRV